MLKFNSVPAENCKRVKRVIVVFAKVIKQHQ